MIEALKKKVLEVYDTPINTAKDCEQLSNAILEKTSRSLSPSTLRRFFGLLPSKSSLSKYNLDTLAQYCESIDYNSFSSTNKGRVDNTKGIIERVNRLNTYTLESIKRKSLSSYDFTVAREGINRYIDYFRTSTYAFLPLMAPGGSGKSIALAHWVEKNEGNDFVFISADILYQHLHNPLSVNTGLSFDFANKNNPLLQFLRKKNPLLLIIDEFEEVSNSKSKTDLIVNYVLQSLEKYGANNQMKIMLGVRDAGWRNIFDHHFSENSKLKKLLAKGLLDMPLLSAQEVRHFFKRKNEDSKDTLNYDCLPWHIRDFIKHPTQLHIFTETLESPDDNLTLSATSIYHNHISKLVFQAKYAEQKEDILWKIIEMMITDHTLSIDKNKLKKLYPIHLKREPDYYNAYKELLDIGLIYEERLPNKYRLFSTYIRIRHTNIFYYLCALYLVKENIDFSSKLLFDVANSNFTLEWKAAVIADIYNVAYETENFEAIKSLCDLPHEILSSIQIRFKVCLSFRHKNAIWDKVVNEYMKSDKGRLYFFEHFVDTNYLYNNYKERIERYLTVSEGDESRIFGNSILFLSGFLQLDLPFCEHQNSILDKLEPSKGIHPYPISRKLAYFLLYQGFVIGKPFYNVEERVLKYQALAYAYPDYLSFGFIAFEPAVLKALILTKQYNVIVKLFSNVYENYNIDNPKDKFFSLLSHNQNSLPYFFLEYAKFKMCIDYDADLSGKIGTFLDGFKTAYDDFQYQILLNWMVFDLNHSANPKLADEYFKNAIEISQYADYTFYEKFLILNHPHTSEIVYTNLQNDIENLGFSPKMFLGHLKN